MKRVTAGLVNLILNSRVGQRLQQQKMPYYAVAAGWETGVFETWATCEKKVKGYSKPIYKKFPTLVEAEAFLKANGVESPSASASPSFDPRQDAVPLPKSSSKSSKEPPRRGIRFPEILPAPLIEDQWPDDLEWDKNDDEILLAAAEEVEGISDAGANRRKRNLGISDSDSAPKKLKKYSHESVIWEPVGLKKIGNHEFPVDSEGYIIVYTDGSCVNNGQANAVAGFGVFFSNDHPLNAAKPVVGRVTNNAGEIQAAIYAIQIAKDFGIKKLCLSTDSQFLINAVTAWIKGWKQKGWKLKNGEPVKNVDDFKKLDNLLDNTIDIKWNYVKGHKGIEGNEKADQLARQGAEIYRKMMKK